MEITGKKAVVFGGASGMGRASAELLASRGQRFAPK
jgi:NAD(P)-dependent dehydrogenase (short-subunit alcohol dehydrogenase family)